MTCCGRPMQRDGNQLVCTKCGTWIDPGTQGGANSTGTGACTNCGT